MVVQRSPTGNMSKSRTGVATENEHEHGAVRAGGQVQAPADMASANHNSDATAGVVETGSANAGAAKQF